MFAVALTLTNSSLSGDVAAGGPARAPRLQLGQEGLLHRLLQRDALQIKNIQGVFFSLDSVRGL